MQHVKFSFLLLSEVSDKCNALLYLSLSSHGPIRNSEYWFHCKWEICNTVLQYELLSRKLIFLSLRWQMPECTPAPVLNGLIAHIIYHEIYPTVLETPPDSGNIAYSVSIYEHSL